MNPRSAPFLLLTLLGLTFSCASATAQGDERALVRLQLYQSGQRFELASESHTDPVTYYSQVRRQAVRKVIPDEVLLALISELGNIGFDRYAQHGKAPTGGSGVIARSFEIQKGDDHRHWPIGKPSNVEEQLEFQQMMKVFLSVYNLTESYQAVQNRDGSSIFEKKRAGTP